MDKISLYFTNAVRPEKMTVKYFLANDCVLCDVAYKMRNKYVFCNSILNDNKNDNYHKIVDKFYGKN